MFLATDLDGTFLGGPEADRLALYEALRADRETRLTFVTGRGAETVIPLLDDPLLPDPEFIIADVGATVLHREGLRPVQPLQNDIERCWFGTRAITSALAGLEGLERQTVPQERRCSFFLYDPAVLPEIRRRLAHLACEVLYSAGRFLDVLPIGVSKGSTLRRLVDHLGVSDDGVLVAGDTMNDLSLYLQGFRGVAVGNSEEALLSATGGLPWVLHAASPGAGGILEAIHALGFRL